MEKKELKLTYACYKQLSELDVQDQELIVQAQDAIKGSYSPYSHFAVGAAVKLSNGIIIKGSNQENAAYPSGLCAERVALFSAGSKYPGVAIEAIAISVNSPYTESESPLAPCGACRQVMIEYEHLHKKPMRVLMYGRNGDIIIIEKAKDLLPFNFQADYLKIK